MSNQTIQQNQLARTTVIYVLRMLAQGTFKPANDAGICSTLNHQMRSRGYKEQCCAWIQSIGIPDPETGYPTGYYCDVVGTLALDYWLQQSGERSYPVPGGSATYDEHLVKKTLWLGQQGEYRRELCTLIADLLEREEVSDEHR